MKRILLLALLALLASLPFAIQAQKISALPAAAALNGPEIVPMTQSGATVGASATQIANFIGAASNDLNILGNWTFSAASGAPIIINSSGTVPALTLNGGSGNLVNGDLFIQSNTTTFGGILLTSATATQEFVALRNTQNVSTSYAEVALQGGSGTDNLSIVMTNPNWPARGGVPAGQAGIISAIPGTHGPFPLALATANGAAILISGAGNVSVLAPPSGTALTINGVTGQLAQVSTQPVGLPSFTVSTLPTCNATLKGGLAYVTDATSPTYNGALTGSGAVVVPVFCNGTAWTAH